MGILNKIGIPGTKSIPELWALDPRPGTKPINEYAFLLLVSPDAELIDLLANRTDGAYAFAPDALLDEHEPDTDEYTDAGRPVPIRKFKILTVNETKQLTADDPGVHELPDGLVGTNLPQRRFDKGDLADYISEW